MEREQGCSHESSTIVLRREFPLLGAYVAPRTETERKIADIWRNALSMDEVGIADNFEDLGGDSLLALSIFAEIEEKFGIAAPVGLLARARTVEHLASRVDALIRQS